MEIKYIISKLFPKVKNIEINIVDTNAWNKDRLRKFEYNPNSETSFYIECPMSKCIGNDSGILFKDAIVDMVNKKEKKRKEKLQCRGYGGYNQSFHCDWYVELEISIEYDI